MMENTNKTGKSRRVTASILSLSLLTVMAGAAVAPALNVIREYFSDAPTVLIQLIISIPALFIVITSIIFPILARSIKSRTLVLIGLLLYTAGGCAAGAFSDIILLLCARALVGIGVGIIMPLSTGLLSFYYSREEQDKLMGLSSAMNQMGGVIATLLSGLLAEIDWRLSFMVYLMGLISIVLCLLFLPNENIRQEDSQNTDSPLKLKGYFPYILSIFLLMLTFFIYPSDFAMETAKAGIIPQSLVAVIMASMDFAAFAGGLAYAFIRSKAGGQTGLIAPVLFLAGYLVLNLSDALIPTLIGSWMIGFANGTGIPLIMSSVGQKAGKLAATTVMPLLSAALYLAQFITPVFLSVITGVIGESAVPHLSYAAAVVTSILLIISSCFIRTEHK